MSYPAHRATTRHLGAAYPFAVAEGLGSGGVVVGHDVFGGIFSFDPFELYAAGVITSPNMLVLGQIGRGKSAFVKSFLWRQALFGTRAWVVDPKGEYGGLARAWGVAPLRLLPGGNLRLNPLDMPLTSAQGLSTNEKARRRGELLAALASASLGRAVSPEERSAIDLAVEASGSEPTLPGVVEAMLDPSEESARSLHSARRLLAADGRQVALELRRLVTGDLRGMFDGHTTPGIDLDGPLVVLDLSALYRSDALGVIITCATAWLQAALGAGDRAPGAGDRAPGRVIVVVDEAWAVMKNLAVARWLQSSWKLARSFGVANVAVMHRLSDLLSAGAAGSEQVELARGLLADSETRVVYGQAPSEVPEARRELGLSLTEAGLLGQLGRGVALWQVGGRSFVVRHLLSPAEQQMVDTDAAMRARPPNGQ